MLEEAVRLHQAGQLEQAAGVYRKVLAADPHNADALHLLGMVALQHGQARPAAELIARAIAAHDGRADYHFHHALALQTLGDMEGAVAGYRRALALKPDNPDTYNNMANALAALGRRDEALECFRHLLALQPGNAFAHNNLGNVQRALGLAVDAEASFRKAIALDPALTSALVNLGNMQWQQGLVAEADALYARALDLSDKRGQPNDPALLDNLAMLRLASGDNDGAAAMIRRSLALAETVTAKKLFVQLAARAEGGDDGMRVLLVRALTEPWERPAALAPTAARMLRADPVLGPLIARADQAWPARPALAELLGETGFKSVADHPLLEALLTSAPNMDLGLERYLASLRSAMLREAVDSPEAERVAALLAQQCFINEYVFLPAEGEITVANATRAALESGETVAPLRLLLLACYVPLHRLANAETLLAGSWPAAVETVLTRQLREPLEERRLRTEIPRLTEIADAVSHQVREQYEENPYPRWIRAAPAVPDAILDFLAAKFPEGGLERPAAAPEDFLIAGCGTGQRSIAMARKFTPPNMLALDLSLTALCYARRKADELGLEIDHGQADILEMRLELEERKFDVIESLGVLHHLADPWEGWRRLLSLLRPGGVMLLGLYSEKARRPVTEIRSRIARRGLAPSPGEIRAFRQELIDDAGTDASITGSEDFFSLSGVRDLLFHAQEHQTSLPAIGDFLGRHGLRLLGFELDDAVLSAYRRRFPQDRAASDLGLWDQFEAEHPGLFGGMYIFWVQKPVAE